MVYYQQIRKKLYEDSTSSGLSYHQQTLNLLRLSKRQLINTLRSLSNSVWRRISSSYSHSATWWLERALIYLFVLATGKKDSITTLLITDSSIAWQCSSLFSYRTLKSLTSFNSWAKFSSSLNKSSIPITALNRISSTKSPTIDFSWTSYVQWQTRICWTRRYKNRSSSKCLIYWKS